MTKTEEARTPGLTFEELQRAHAAGIRACNWRLLSQPVSMEILDNYLPAAVAAIRPAPSSPGVPDSVREAIQCLDEIRDEETKSLQSGGGARLYRIIPQQSHAEALALEYVRTLLSTHPAGQSAGQGAECDQVDADLIQMLIADNARMRAAGTKLSEASLRVIREYDGTHRLSLAVAEWAEAIADEGGRADRFKPAIRDLAALAARPAAPEAQGADDLADRLRREIGEIRIMAADPENKGAFCELTVVADNLEALLAAGPATPEAQGAWRPMSEAPKDGTWILGWQADTARYGGKPANVVRWFEGMWTGWKCDQPRDPSEWIPLPAPPSSGQGGR